MGNITYEIRQATLTVSRAKPAEPHDEYEATGTGDTAGKGKRQKLPGQDKAKDKPCVKVFDTGTSRLHRCRGKNLSAVQQKRRIRPVLPHLHCERPTIAWDAPIEGTAPRRCARQRHVWLAGCAVAAWTLALRASFAHPPPV